MDDEIINDILTELLRSKTIVESVSPWNAPIILIKKRVEPQVNANTEGKEGSKECKDVKNGKRKSENVIRDDLPLSAQYRIAIDFRKLNLKCVDIKIYTEK